MLAEQVLWCTESRARAAVVPEKKLHKIGQKSTYTHARINIYQYRYAYGNIRNYLFEKVKLQFCQCQSCVCVCVCMIGKKSSLHITNVCGAILLAAYTRPILNQSKIIILVVSQASCTTHTHTYNNFLPFSNRRAASLAGLQWVVSATTTAAAAAQVTISVLIRFLFAPPNGTWTRLNNIHSAAYIIIINIIIIIIIAIIIYQSYCNFSIKDRTHGHSLGCQFNLFVTIIWEACV